MLIRTDESECKEGEYYINSANKFARFCPQTEHLIDKGGPSTKLMKFPRREYLN